MNIKNIFNSSKIENNQLESNIMISKAPSSPKIILVIFPFEKDFFRVASYSYRNLPYDRKILNFII